jgi:alginate O-acetyltransferase complex protein AlgI
MQLIHIGVFVLGALVYVLIVPPRARAWALLLASVVTLYALQPRIALAGMDFALPTLTLILTVAVWLFTQAEARADGPRFSRADGVTMFVVIVVVVGLAATRLLALPLVLTASRPPDLLTVALGVGAAVLIVALLWWPLRDRPWRFGAVMAVLVLLFVVLKTEPLATAISAALRSLSGRSAELASSVDLAWLGFSYIAFRLLHVLRDKQLGTLPRLSLRDHLIYVVFFPALTAGPIDRAERFAADLAALPSAPLRDAARFGEAFGRLGVGIFKKFVLGDTLALFALSNATAEQATSAPALWLLTYAYALRLFLDFSGYTDIVIGIGLLCGIRLPENFDRPYLKPSITEFWQSWHRTLSDWVRFYVFSPFSRWLLGRGVDGTAAVAAAQLATMLIIGLWHGVTWTFVIWGLWHGVALFVHKLFTDRTRLAFVKLRKEKPRRLQWLNAAGALLTFHVVTVGWVWFALADAGLAARTVLRLFGLAW